MHARTHALVCIAITLCAGTAAAQPNYQGAYGYQMSLDGGLTWEGPNSNALTFDVPRLTDVRMRLTATLYNQTALGINGMSGQVLFTRNLGHSSDFQVLSPALVPPFNSFSQTLNVSSPDASQAFRIRRNSSIFDARQSPVGSPDFTPALTVPLVEWTLRTSDRLFMTYLVSVDTSGSSGLAYYTPSGQTVYASPIENAQHWIRIVPAPSTALALLLPLAMVRRRRSAL